jgi:hypothetical protein
MSNEMYGISEVWGVAGVVPMVVSFMYSIATVEP